MTIVIDARWIFPEISGIGHYTRSLIAGLARLESSHRFLLLFQDPAIRDRTITETGIAGHPAFQTRLVPYGLFDPSNQWRLPWLLLREHANLYHAPNAMLPLAAFPAGRRGRIRAVVTLHDMIPMLFPEATPKARKTRLAPLYRFLMRQIARRADGIITVSRASRNDITRILRIPARQTGKVHVIYNGVESKFQPPPDPPVMPTPDRPGRLLYVGRADPYKNLTVLVRAVAKARTLCPFPIRLSIAGSPDPRYPEAQALANSLGITDIVHWTGYLSDADLVRTYQQSDLLVHPSRYEGFGLQVLEAMASGLPVLSSNAASLPEVAGDAAVLLEPDDEDGFAVHLTRLLADPAERARLRARGIEQARRFTWERTATETLTLYNELLKTS
ncbi:MAG: hypothetical protein A2498_01955 [Lentisphaerae bacterium RIFOXYC12_FULL_60_16]|nr:MAG: hypothetical protein A2498_01955 [Lentisphaerae bacterium RIFOXYC12_FULL_60_16]OGV84111.1 MAG: hypothetical protein A2340_13585 [Lentisphaerae bacterium RIFOXYB12_FULL_60_10]